MTDLRELEINAFLAQGDTLAQLVAHPGWPSYVGLLREMRLAALEQLATADPTTVAHWQGVAATLGEIIDRPTRIIAAAAEYQRAEEVDKKVIRTELRAAIGMGVDYEGDV